MVVNLYQPLNDPRPVIILYFSCHCQHEFLYIANAHSCFTKLQTRYKIWHNKKAQNFGVVLLIPSGFLSLHIFQQARYIYMTSHLVSLHPNDRSANYLGQMRTNANVKIHLALSKMPCNYLCLQYQVVVHYKQHKLFTSLNNDGDNFNEAHFCLTTNKFCVAFIVPPHYMFSMKLKL